MPDPIQILKSTSAAADAAYARRREEGIACLYSAPTHLVAHNYSESETGRDMLDTAKHDLAMATAMYQFDPMVSGRALVLLLEGKVDEAAYALSRALLDHQKQTYATAR